MFTSSSRLDLGITVGPTRLHHIKAILSGPLPIFIDFQHVYEDISRSALWRMRAALKHRVREISFTGSTANFDKLFVETKCAFSDLESLALSFGNCKEPHLPDVFLGPDPSNSQLRRLRLLGQVSLASISGFLLSTTALTDLHLEIDFAFCPSQGTSLLACLQGMPCLRILDLDLINSPDSPPQPSTSKDIVSLSKLTSFHYRGHNNLFLDALVARLSAPSLWDVKIDFSKAVEPHIEHLPRFIDEIQESYYAVHVVFREWGFRLSLFTRSDFKPSGNIMPSDYFTNRDWNSRFELNVPSRSPESLLRMSGALSTKFATVEEVRIDINEEAADVWKDNTLWRRFYQPFSSVKAFREEGPKSTHWIARIFSQDHGEPVDPDFFPALKEIDLGQKAYVSRDERKSRLKSFLQFAAARRQAGRPIKVFFRTLYG
jgi:hypothetical protein